MKRIAILLAVVAAIISAGTASAQESLLIDKGAFKITLLSEDGVPLMEFPVATGRYPGQKRYNGDCRTPEGDFSIIAISDMRNMYYYDSTYGYVRTYGSYFCLLETGYTGIGIHGTFPQKDHQIGTRASLGCVRLHDEDILVLYPHLFVGMKVKIIPGTDDLRADGRLTDAE